MCVFIASLIPVDISVLGMDINYWDKIQHAVAYAFLALLGLRAFPKQVNYILLGLCFMGGMIELLQSVLAWRHGEVLDFAANSLGIFLVYCFSHILKVEKTGSEIRPTE